MILVTGALGLIGSAALYELNQQGREDILLVDRFRQNDKWKNVQGLKFQDFIVPEELFSEDIVKVFDSVEMIFHMGACSSTTEKDMDFLWFNNVDYSRALFEMATEKKIPIIYASSAATYGNGEHGYADSIEAMEKLRPLNEYGFSKKVFDDWVVRQKNYPPKWFGVKFFNVYGPNEYHKNNQASVVFHAYNQIRKDGVVKLFKSYKSQFRDGEQQRDFIYVKDVAKAMVSMMSAPSGKSGIYNLGTGEARTWNELVGAIFKALKMETKIEYIEMPESIKNQYQYYTCADMKKFNEAFPQISFRATFEGVEDYVIRYLNTENPYLDSGV